MKNIELFCLLVYTVHPTFKNVLIYSIELELAFRIFDKDGDGTISSVELGTVLQSLGQNPTPEQLEEIIQEVDEDGNGIIDFEEFVCLMMKQNQSNATEESLLEAFRLFDVNNNGYLTIEELYEMMTNRGDKLTDDEFTDMINEIDIDGDGQIAYEEIVKTYIKNN
ncbi:hypothetical protein A3Q56_06298 [Intoshia linei]|uniref:EF-hand domain-containing protein n=1 Tax=Intoshia linei TaxID=1819745 RepID=A0A177AVE0_9BILA|nr:hypothetical protein A3Q56_06298 [Intoshia linei]